MKYEVKITVYSINAGYKRDVDKKIDFYRTKTSAECGELLNAPPALAYTNRLVNDTEHWLDCIVCAGLNFLNKDGYDLLLSAGFGVVIYNNFSKINYMTGFEYDSINDLENDTITFSIPIDYIGKPQEDWKYFIGAGIQRDYGAGIVYSGIMDVKISEGIEENDNFSNSRFLDVMVPMNSQKQSRMIQF